MKIVGAALALAVRVSAVPSFVVNLDYPPEQRWVEVVRYYRDEMIAMSAQMKPMLKKQLGDDMHTFVDTVSFDKEYEAELQGMANAINHTTVTVEGLKLSNMLYEMASPTACSGVLWTMANGTVLHGRNMDYAFHFTMPDGRTLNWPDVTFEVTMMKNNQPFMKQTQWPGGVGIHTAMRFGVSSATFPRTIGGWSFEQNTRTGNDWHANLAASKEGAQLYGTVLRRIMEETPDFETAITKVYAAKFMAPQYFIMSGSGPYEGAVITIDRNGKYEADTPPIQRLSKSSSTAWHLVQTNDDLLAPAADPRRPVANLLLKVLDQRNVTDDNLAQFMHTPLLFNKVTAFTTVMSPATGLYKTILPNEPPASFTFGMLEGGSGLGLLEKQAVVPAQVPVPHARRQKKFLAARSDKGQGDDLSALMQTQIERLET